MTTRHFTASAVVFSDDAVLLVFHNKIGLWLYPGGHIDPNETPAEAAVREVAEETGVNAVVLSPPGLTHAAVTNHPVPWAIIEMDIADARHGPHRHIDFVYVCHATRHAPTVNLDEVAAARWVPLADLTTYQTPPDLPNLIGEAARWAKSR